MIGSRYREALDLDLLMGIPTVDLEIYNVYLSCLFETSSDFGHIAYHYSKNQLIFH